MPVNARPRLAFGSAEAGTRPFRDRRDAGAKLSAAFHGYRGARPLVIGIARGGVPVAAELASRLEGELDVIVARKITAPDRPGLGLGAITADGARRMNSKLRVWSTVSDAALATIAEQQRASAETAESRWRAGLPAIDPSDRLVILVDDGLATGATMGAAVSSLRQRGCEQLMIAVPVGASDACNAIAREVDGFVCLQRPRPFVAVGDSYEQFPTVTDREVEQLLRRHREHHALAGCEVSRL
jgi:predicted phosphoribosyltransferase